MFNCEQRIFEYSVKIFVVTEYAQHPYLEVGWGNVGQGLFGTEWGNVGHLHLLSEFLVKLLNLIYSTVCWVDGHHQTKF